MLSINIANVPLEDICDVYWWLVDMIALHIRIQIYGYFIRFVSKARYIDFGKSDLYVRDGASFNRYVCGFIANSFIISLGNVSTEIAGRVPRGRRKSSGFRDHEDL